MRTPIHITIDEEVLKEIEQRIRNHEFADISHAVDRCCSVYFTFHRRGKEASSRSTSQD
jgi:hypothetical protein